MWQICIFPTHRSTLKNPKEPSNPRLQDTSTMDNEVTTVILIDGETLTNLMIEHNVGDQMGRYNLVYSVDYRFQEMISEEFASMFI